MVKSKKKSLLEVIHQNKTVPYLTKEFLDALHRGSQIIPSPLRGEG